MLFAFLSRLSRPPRFRAARPLALGLCLALCVPASAPASSLDFTVTRKGAGAPVVLIVGGIQGDEPGGFSAAALLATQYRFTRGTALVVPNLNFPSIIQRSRGLHGDMNRKFAELAPADPEYATVRRIQEIIAHPDVALVLNMHDGSGLYRPTRESAMRNPDRWGQSVIIDQDEWPGVAFGNLRGIAEIVTAEANRSLLHPDHALHIKNTQTAATQGEMAKCLTWYALNHGKPAFGLEVSKDFDVATRAYYQLCMAEAFLRYAGLDFERDFALTRAGVAEALGRDVTVSFAGNRLVLPLENARRQLAGRLPLPRGAEESIGASMPLVAVTASDGRLNVHYGNNTVTSFRPDWMEMDDAPPAVTVRVDGRDVPVPFGATLHVDKEFIVRGMDGCRVNAIGANRGPNGGADESGVSLRLRDFQKAYSIDKAGTLYRVEVYRGKRYAGTFLARFGEGAPGSVVLPDMPGRESDLGW